VHRSHPNALLEYTSVCNLSSAWQNFINIVCKSAACLLLLHTKGNDEYKRKFRFFKIFLRVHLLKNQATKTCIQKGVELVSELQEGAFFA
jgi:hypothetical protein